MRLITNCLEKPCGPLSSANQTSAMPPTPRRFFRTYFPAKSSDIWRNPRGGEVNSTPASFAHTRGRGKNLG